MSDHSYLEWGGGFAYVDYPELKDGTKICCIVAKPAKEGTFPVVLSMNAYIPYQKELVPGYDLAADDGTEKNAVNVVAEVLKSQGSIQALHQKSPVADAMNAALMYGGPDYLRNGYAVVVFETRGTGNSEYESFLPYVHEAEDQVELLQWVRGQDFYQGEIFCEGISYMGFTAISNLYGEHEDIKAVSAGCPVSLRYDEWYRNGFMNIGVMGWWQTQNMRPKGFDAPAISMALTAEGRIDANRRFHTFPYTDAVKAIYGYDEEQFSGLMRHPKDGEWWRTEVNGHEIYKAIENIDVPLLLIEGFYDIFVAHSLKIWDSLSDEVRAKSAMVITQGNHMVMDAIWPFENAFPGDSFYTYAYNHYILDFFNSVREGRKPQNTELGKISFYPIEGKEWLYDEKLSNGKTAHTVFLNAGGKLELVPGAVAELTYTYDPNDPAEFGGNEEASLGNMHWCGGIGADPESGSRQDILTFLAEPVREDTLLKGKFHAELDVSSDCEDTCFLVRVDVVKKGVAYNLRGDITSLSHQLGSYTPGEKVRLFFDTSAVACLMRPGDYLRVDVSSSAKYMYSLHTNVAGNQWEIAEPKIAHNTLYSGNSKLIFYTE